MNYFVQYENPGDFYHYDWRNDPRELYDEDVNLPDFRGIHFRIKVLEEIEED